MSLFTWTTKEKVDEAIRHVLNAKQYVDRQDYPTGLTACLDCVEELLEIYVWCFKKGEFGPHILLTAARTLGMASMCYVRWNAARAPISDMEKHQRLGLRSYEAQKKFQNILYETMAYPIDEEGRKTCEQALIALAEGIGAASRYADQALASELSTLACGTPSSTAPRGPLTKCMVCGKPTHGTTYCAVHTTFMYGLGKHHGH